MRGLALVAGAFVLVGGCRQATDETATTKSPLVEVRPARESPAPGYVFVEFAYPELAAADHDTRGMYVEPRTILTDEDFLIDSWEVGENKLALDVRLKPEAAARAERETRPLLGQRLATLLDGKLVGAPLLLSTVGTYPELPIFVGLRVPTQVAQDVAARLAARGKR
ncbi:MAG: hypothetical protein ACT4PM_05655 [Gemmatimonadales bacterium]